MPDRRLRVSGIARCQATTVGHRRPRRSRAGLGRRPPQRSLGSTPDVGSAGVASEARVALSSAMVTVAAAREAAAARRRRRRRCRRRARRRRCARRSICAKCRRFRCAAGPSARCSDRDRAKRHDGAHRHEQDQRREGELFAKADGPRRALLCVGQPRGDNSGSATPASANPRARSRQLSQRAARTAVRAGVVAAVRQAVVDAELRRRRG